MKGQPGYHGNLRGRYKERRYSGYYSLTSSTNLPLVCQASPAISSTPYPHVEEYKGCMRLSPRIHLPLRRCIGMQTKEICSLYTTSMLSTSTMTMTRLRPAARVLRSEPLPRGRVMIPQENNNKNITLLSTHHRRSLGCSLKRSHLLKCKWKEADNSDSPPSSYSAHSSTSNTTRSLSSTLLLSRMVCVE